MCIRDRYKTRVETEAGAGYIRGTHTAWRHRNYVFIADEVLSLIHISEPTRPY